MSEICAGCGHAPHEGRRCRVVVSIPPTSEEFDRGKYGRHVYCPCKEASDADVPCSRCGRQEGEHGSAEFAYETSCFGYTTEEEPHGPDSPASGDSRGAAVPVGDAQGRAPVTTIHDVDRAMDALTEACDRYTARRGATK